MQTAQSQYIRPGLREASVAIRFDFAKTVKQAIAMDVLRPLLEKGSVCNGTDDEGNPLGDYTGATRTTSQQTVISVVLGLSAFLTFCVSRPLASVQNHARLTIRP